MSDQPINQEHHHDGLSMLWILTKIFGLGAVCLLVAWVVTWVMQQL